jgi:hypothetical protein
MATDPIGGNPAEFPVNPTPAPQGGPPNFGAMQDAINAMAEANLALSKSVSNLVDNMTRAADEAERLRKETGDVDLNIKSALNSASKIMDVYKTSADIFDSIRKKQSITYAEAQKALKDMIELNKRAAQGDFGSTAAKVAAKNVQDLEIELKKLDKTMAGCAASTKLEAETLEDFTKATNNANTAVRSLVTTGNRLEDHVKNLNRQYRDAGIQVKSLTKLEELWARNRAFNEIKELRKSHKAETRATVQQKMKDLGLATAFRPPAMSIPLLSRLPERKNTGFSPSKWLIVGAKVLWALSTGH